MKISCTRIGYRERKKKRKTKSTQCLMKSKKMKFQKHQKIKSSSRYLKLLVDGHIWVSPQRGKTTQTEILRTGSKLFGVVVPDRFKGSVGLEVYKTYG